MPRTIRRKRIRQAGNLEAVKRKLWQAIVTANDILLDAEKSDDVSLKAIHALSQATAVYARLYETAEVKKELEQLRKEVRELRSQQILRAVA